MVRGLLVVFEGLDQSGKQTQAEALRDWLTAKGRVVRMLSFPTYETHIGAEIGRLRRTYGDVPTGGLLAYEGSGGAIEIAVRDGSAARRLGMGVGGRVRARLG